VNSHSQFLVRKYLLYQLWHWDLLTEFSFGTYGTWSNTCSSFT
jgi:hypothetical protein